MPSSAQRPARRLRERGFSVLEIMVAVVLLGVVLLTAFSVFNATLLAYLRGKDRADEHQNARVVLEWMVRRIRLAGLGVVTPPSFTAATADTVAFFGDVDGDGVAEWHRFCLEPSEGVVRTEVAATDQGTASCTPSIGTPITSRGLRPVRIVRLEFAYFRGDESALPAPVTGPLPRSQITRVRIRLALDSNRSGGYEAASDLAVDMDAVRRNRE